MTSAPNPNHGVWLPLDGAPCSAVDDQQPYISVIGGRKAAGCRRSFADGHIEVTYIVLRKTGDNPLSWIEVSADLVSTAARYAAARRVFEHVLRGIRVHPDGPDD